jgi:hypothetical protein
MLVLTYDVTHLSCGHHEEEENTVEGFPPVGHGKGIHLILKNVHLYSSVIVGYSDAALFEKRKTWAENIYPELKNLF